MDISVRERIKALVDEGKYRDMTDFAVKAILEKLEREEMDERTRFKMMLMDLVKTDKDVQAVIEDWCTTPGRIF